MSNFLHRQRLLQAQSSVDFAKRVVDGLHRQRYHFMAPAYWINDPNGCIFFEGKYHLFYQHNPFAPFWGSMHWGHAVSEDLVHWQHMPIALAPSESYDDHPEGGIFSGSTIYHNGVLYAFYTGAVKKDDILVQTQCLAESRDGGVTFEKYLGNPVIPNTPCGASTDFRDPKVFRVGELWYMVVGSSMGGGAKGNGEGCVQLYQSDNLKTWHYRGIIARSNKEIGSMWECPDLFRLGKKWVLIFSPMFCGDSKTVYQVGNMDFKNAQFTCESQGEIDWGCEYYAPQSMQDSKGRTVLIAWQNGWDWMPWWKGFGPTASENWCGSMALPREVSLEPDNKLAFRPVRELVGLRANSMEENGLVIGSEPHLIPCENPVCFEMSIVIDLEKTTAGVLHIYLRAYGEKYTKITVDFHEKTLIFDREHSDGYSCGIRTCRMELHGKRSELRIFSDTSSIELFADGGRTTMSNTIYPTHEGQRNFLCAEGGEVIIPSLHTWEMLRIDGGI